MNSSIFPWSFFATRKECLAKSGPVIVEKNVHMYLRLIVHRKMANASTKEHSNDSSNGQRLGAAPVPLLERAAEMYNWAMKNVAI